MTRARHATPQIRCSLQARVARVLELEPPGSSAGRALARVWVSFAQRGLARPLQLPPGVRVIGVGGATLGGSYKSGTAVAIAQALAARGASVALVGHAYRARPARARWVSVDDPVGEVGDDALAAARQLAPAAVRVAVAPTRQAAVDFAAREAGWLVVDGLLQSSPARLFRALLLLESARPWGNGHCPPAGDLRAARPDLVRAADALAVVNEDVGHLPDAARARGQPSAPPCEELGLAAAAAAKPVHHVRAYLDLPRTLAGSGVSLAELQRGEGVGLLLCIARPERVLRSLAAQRIVPHIVWRYGDHEAPRASDLAQRAKQLGRAAPRVWLTTAKCMTKLPARIAGAPVLALAHACVPSPELMAWLCSDCAPLPFPAAGPVVDCPP